MNELQRLSTDKLPSEVREQDGPVGGAEDGTLPLLEVPVVVQGVTFVREVPTLRANAGSAILGSTSPYYRLGREPNRRRVTIRCNDTNPAAAGLRWITVATSQSQIQSSPPQGLQIPPGGSHTLLCADELWFTYTGNDALYLSFFAELDQG